MSKKGHPQHEREEDLQTTHHGLEGQDFLIEHSQEVVDVVETEETMEMAEEAEEVCQEQQELEETQKTEAMEQSWVAKNQ